MSALALFNDMQPLVRLLTRRNITTAFGYIRHGQFKGLYRHALRAASRSNIADTTTQLVIPPLLESRTFPLLPDSTDIIIPVYNGLEFLPTLFASISRNTYSPYRLIIIDDASSDLRI